MDLRVEPERGLGGKALAERRPRLTGDYRNSTLITHHYDAEISAEGIVALLAMPVVVEGKVRAVLYGGTRGAPSPVIAFAPAVGDICAALAQEIRIEDEVMRRVARHQEHAPRLSGSMLEDLRSGHAELRRIVADVQDVSIRTRLSELEQRLARLGVQPSPPASVAHLTSREIDVLSHAALGGTNSEIGKDLGIAESTVKSYLNAAMRKLDASTRHAAVSAARQAGIIF